MSKKKKYLFFIYLFFPFLLSAQKTLNLKNTYTVNITTKDTCIRTEAFYGPKTITPKADVVYYWYLANKVVATKGAYQGRLLNGSYHVFFTGTKKLKEKGAFQNGAKINEWVSWYDNGVIKQSFNWKKGKLNGLFKTYDGCGNIAKAGSYRNNLLNGDLYEYKNGKLLRTLKYKNGVEVSENAIAVSGDTIKPDKPKVTQKKNPATSRSDTAALLKPVYKKNSTGVVVKKKPTATVLATPKK